MRLLIAYDGSAGADAALDDLARAGLGNSVEAVILSVAELWLPPPPPAVGQGESFPLYTPPGLKSAREHVAQVVEQVRTWANNASARLQTTFPAWKVTVEISTGSPSWEIIDKADKWNPDLVVVGSHGRSRIGQFFLGSVSQKILTEAHCSIRIGRQSTHAVSEPMRLLVAVDGSPHAHAAVKEVTGRDWLSGAQVTVVTVEDPSMALALGSLDPLPTEWSGGTDEGAYQWVRKMVEASAEELREVGPVKTVITQGDAKKVLIHEAKRLGADCIFVGATGLSNRLERFLLGSVSAAVANRAECSVEVVRNRAVREG
jgi:nucleotide-binding universal stress UspA family protein